MSKKSLHPHLPRVEQKQRSRDRLINLLLTAIIRANPHHDPTVKDETRLARAREALLGEPNSRGRKSIKDDLQLFPVYQAAFRAEHDIMKRVLLAVQDYEIQEEWKEQLEEGYASETGIAKKFAPKFSREMTEQKSIEDWLRKIIGGLSFTSTDMADLEGLVSGDSPKAERLQRILADLEAIGIPSKSLFRTEMDDLNPDTD
ncbi:hypothetical protein [Falsiphaeobacter marinintestinus]|uniref:hypothetical protein n=1 Tax=Falsiphaeobacter marinintestinus TaxID=1492905 RepID=UPI0011B71418|nr:hypothetical protein [Phaeobacter marinintestinus]